MAGREERKSGCRGRSESHCTASSYFVFYFILELVYLACLLLSPVLSLSHIRESSIQFLNVVSLFSQCYLKNRRNKC